MQLRKYQQTAVERMLWALTIPGNSLLSLPTGAGKSHIIAEFVAKVNQPVLVFTPSKELLEQDYEKLCNVIPKENIGIFSASKGTKDINTITIATIQSAYKHPELFRHYKVVIIDEASGVNPKSLDGMYNSFLKAIGSPKVIGLDATCFRLDTFYRATGQPWQPYETVTTTKILTRYKEMFWRQFVCVINTQDLMNAGYLSPLVYEDHSFYKHEELKTNKSASDFDLEAFDELMGSKEPEMAEKIVYGQNYLHKSSLVFCSSLEQAKRLSRAILGSRVVSSETPTKERESIIKDFKDGSIKTVLNMGVLTRGFDHPGLDAIYMIRPTKSINLYCQMLGRGTRLAEGKNNCTVYDFAGNLRSIGTLESVKIEKVDSKWNVTTNRFPTGAHYKELYSFKISGPHPAIEGVTA